MQNETLSHRTAENLRRMIIKNKVYKYGEKLPNEIDLSEELGVSRTTLREALRMLISEGILEVKRGRGTFVARQIDQYAKGGVDVQDLTLKKVTLRDLYETRLIFEPEAAALACKRATDEEIENILRLGEICQQEILKNPQGEKRIASESAFHGAILKATHNDFLSQFMPMLSETIDKTISLNYKLDTLAEVAYKDHIIIMDFLEKRDSSALKSAVTIHLHHAILTEQLPL